MSPATRELMPCVCLDLSRRTTAVWEHLFGACPLCHGTAACSQAAAEAFAEAVYTIWPEEAPQ